MTSGHFQSNYAHSRGYEMSCRYESDMAQYIIGIYIISMHTLFLLSFDFDFAISLCISHLLQKKWSAA